jgi:hypothetical protein
LLNCHERSPKLSKHNQERSGPKHIIAATSVGKNAGKSEVSDETMFQACELSVIIVVFNKIIDPREAQFVPMFHLPSHASSIPQCTTNYVFSACV